MTKLSKIALLAFLTFGIAAAAIPGAALAQSCTSSPIACPPGGGGPGPDDSTIPDIPKIPEIPEIPEVPEIPEPGSNEPGPDLPDDPKPEVPDVPAAGIEAMLSIELDCEIKADEPTTDDFWIKNTGTKELTSGLKIHYEVPATGEKGTFLLPRSLAAGQKGKVNDLIGATPTGTECRAMIVT